MRGSFALSNIQAVEAPDAPPALGAYTPAVVVDGWCFVSGQIGWNADGTGLQERDAAQQTEQTLRNIEALLTAAGASLRDIARTTIYVASLDVVGDVNATYERVLRAAGVEVLPARTTIAVGLPVAVEIDVIARVPQ
jgi:2-iminobutanoate/2-iminopropanoate deaminase